MKRRVEHEEEVDPEFLNRLRNLLDKAAYDTIILFLSKINPNEIHLLSKLPTMDKLRSILNGKGVFKSLYDTRKQDKDQTQVSLLEQDMVRFLELENNQPIDYWKIWLCAYESQNRDYSTLFCANGSISIDVMTGDDFERGYVYHLSVDISKDTIIEESPLYDGDYAKWHPLSRKYQVLCSRVLTQLSANQFPIPVDQLQTHDWGEWITIAMLYFGHEQFSMFESLCMSNPNFVPNNLLKHIKKQKDFTVLSKFEPMRRNTLMQYYPTFKRFFRALFCYLFLVQDNSAFISTSSLKFEPNVALIRTCITCNSPAKYADYCKNAFYCSKDCQRKDYTKE